MKKLFIILLSPLLFLLYGASLDNYSLSIGPCFLFPVEQSSHQTARSENYIKEVKGSKNNLHKEFNIEEGKTLDINLNSGGSVKILGWDKDVVSIDVESSRDDLDDYDIDFTVEDEGIEVESNAKYERSNSGGLHFDFRVPSSFNLKIETAGGGIKIKSVNGDISGKSMGGPLELSDLKGKLDLQTMGGPIKLYDSEVDGKVHTMGGPVEITNVKGDVKGTTNGGPVIMKNVSLKNRNSTKDVVTISTMGGPINVEEAPAGADVKTMGGPITIKSAMKFIKARTNGGDIEIENTNGAIDASTKAGSINAEMVGNPNEGNRDVTLSSNAGDITLIVPDGLSMDINITLAYTENNDGDYNIYSDFPINKEAPPGWDNTHGTPRKFIYGKGSTGNGKYKIKISTINGNVYLKKG